MAFSKEEFFIDVAGIWQHEQRLYQVRKSSPAHYHGLHHYLSHFYLLNQHPPFISREKVQQDPGLAGYYDRYCKRYKEQKGWLLDYFAHGGAFYDMNRSCVIEKSEVTPAHFQKLFALTLRQFEGEAEGLFQFLRFHYYRSFQQNTDSYRGFLLSLGSQEDLLSQELLLQVRLWTGLIDTLSPDGPFREKAQDDVPSAEWLLSLEVGLGLEEPDLTGEEDGTDGSALITLKQRQKKPFLHTGAVPNPNCWTGDECLQFFSFLGQDRGEGEGSYLRKEQVAHLLQGGISVPAEPLRNKYKLNWTPRYPKKLVHQFMYRFIQAYNPAQKRALLQFVGSYIEDYAAALSEENYAGLSSNITGEEARQDKGRFTFSLEAYLPKRLL